MQHRKRKHLEGKTKRTYYWVYCASIKYLVTTIFKLQLHLPKLLCTFKKVTENNLQNGERDLINQAIKYDNLYWEYRKSHTPKNIMTGLNLTLQWTYYIKNCASCSFNYFWSMCKLLNKNKIYKSSLATKVKWSLNSVLNSLELDQFKVRPNANNYFWYSSYFTKGKQTYW